MHRTNFISRLAVLVGVGAAVGLLVTITSAQKPAERKPDVSNKALITKQTPQPKTHPNLRKVSRLNLLKRVTR